MTHSRNAIDKSLYEYWMHKALPLHVGDFLYVDGRGWHIDGDIWVDLVVSL